MRDDFSEATKTALAKRVAYICSNSECGALTSGPNSDPAKAIMVGVAAHITAAAPGGPRYNPFLTPEERRKAENGIWLCQTCGKRVDDDKTTYSEEVLREWKRNAEAAALTKLGKTAPYGALSSLEMVQALAVHVPDEDIQIVVGEGLKRLSALYPDRTLRVYTEDSHVVLEVDRRDRNEPVQIVSFTPVFPDTEEGRARAAAYDRFVRFGEPVELHGSDIPLAELPTEIRATAEKHPELRLRLGAARSSRPMIVAITFESEDGSFYEFPYIDLRVIRGGTEHVVVTNTEQPLPFKFEITLWPSGRTDIAWTFELVNTPIYWLREYLRFRQVIAKPTRTIMTSLEDGLRSVSVSTNKMAIDHVPDHRLYDLVDRVLKIQNLTGSPIRLPNRPAFDDSDAQAIAWFEHVLATGRQSQPPKEVRLTAFGEQAREAVARNIGKPIKARLPNRVERLLDNDINLGAAWVSCESADFIPVGERDEQGRRAFEFQVRARDNATLDVWYERFTKVSAT